VARSAFPDLAMLRLAPVFPRDPDKLREVLPDVADAPGEPDPHDDPRRRLLVRDATDLMTAAMAPAEPSAADTTRASATTRGRLAISLRWGLNPAIGFPRAPFKVWRRFRREDPSVAVAGSGPRSAPATVALSAQVLEVRFDATPAAGRSLVVEALGFNGHVLPGQRLAFTAGGSGRFRAAGISSLRLSGGGQVANVLGLLQTDYARLPDWTLVDVVGFPFAKNEISPPDYDPVPQGRAAPSLDGVDAALLRLTAGQLIQRDPPAPGGGLTVPAWPFPDPQTFLDVLRKEPLPTVADCLMTSRDDDPGRVQALHRPTHTLAGMHQPGISSPTTTADMSLKTTQYVGLAVNDNPVALGLGFGTFDVAPVQGWGIKEQLPVGTFLASTDWMVTAEVTLWFGLTLDLAAIGVLQAPPGPFAQLLAAQTFANRPPARDAVGSASVLLSWAPPHDPLGAGILLQRGGTDAVVNVERPAGSGGFQPYLMPHRIGPDGEPPADERPGVTLPEEPAPRSGSSVTTYAAAPLDVHGRWGAWTLTSHTLVADPVQKPTLNDVRIDLPGPLPTAVPPGGPVVPAATLTVEVSWDWADRSPDRIEVSGRFVPLGPAPTSVTGCQVDSTGPVGAFAVTIGFDAAGSPSIRVPPASPPPPAGSVAVANSAAVVEVADPQSAPGSGAPPGSAASQVRRYRLTLPVRLSFAGVAQLAYAVSAQATEKVRPTELSGPTDPRATTVSDPFPAPPPALPPVTVLWTAQPDAAGRARTVLSWPAVPGASGYIVWEATETALYDAVAGTAPPSGQSIRTRAADLKTRILANQARSLSTFSRLNERPQTATSVELELPGSADTLYVYRLSSITAQNIESARSTDVVMVAVPRLEVPGTPHLEGRHDPDSGQIELTVVPGTGLAPDRLAVHRVRTPLLAEVLDTMGPPRSTMLVSALPAVPVPSLGSAPPRSGFRLTDTAAPDWRPYVYRVVALGRDLPADGIRAGRSPASGAATVVVPPPLPPTLTGLAVARNGSATLVTVSTDLPWLPTPAGPASLTVAGVDAAGVRATLATLDPTTVPEAPALVLPSASGPVTATRRPPAAGTVEVTVLAPATTATIVVAATDPLGRTTATEEI
jgi:hypothetical protein